MTQKNVADKLNITEQAVSKWERGIGLPDVTLLTRLSEILDVNIETILNGALEKNSQMGINMKHLLFFICPDCSNIIFSIGMPNVSCCGRTLRAITAQKATAPQKMKVEQIEDNWYISTDHPMSKEVYISFTAFSIGKNRGYSPLSPVEFGAQNPAGLPWKINLVFQKSGFIVPDAMTTGLISKTNESEQSKIYSVRILFSEAFLNPLDTAPNLW